MPVDLYTSWQDFSTPWTQLPMNTFTFPGGEPHAEIIGLYKKPEIGGYPVVVARIENMEDLGQLLVVTDALRNTPASHRKYTLFIPYFPGARQDRVEKDSGLPFTARVFANVINSLNYDLVVTLDAHSDVTPALLNNCLNLSSLDAVWELESVQRKLYHGIICPDAGAEKKSNKLAAALDIPVIRGGKHRDEATGNITGFYCEPLPDFGDYLLADDICDGGGTFVGLAEEIRKTEFGASSHLDLFVTHGIFSKGISGTLRDEKKFDRVVSTDSLRVHGDVDSVVPIISTYQRQIDAAIENL